MPTSFNHLLPHFAHLLATFSTMLMVTSQKTVLTASSHLCAKIASGHFDKINLRSMTAIRGQNLVIFEGDQKYYVETSLMTSTGLQLDPHKYKWDDNELKTGVMKLISEKQLKPEEVNTVYMIYFENARVPLPNFEGRPFLSKVKLRIDHTKFAALLFTEKTVYTMDIAEESKPILYREYHNKFTEFAIIHDQKQTKQTGYVINKDIYDDTNDLVIYDMISYGGLEMDIQRTAKRGDLKTNSASHQFYFIEKGDMVNKAKLIPREERKKKKGDPKRQLMSSVPRGYCFGNDVFLFDTLLGCVYIIRNLNMSLVKIKKRNEAISLTMDSIPLEQFITCPEFPVVSPFPHDAGRCNLSPEVEPPQEPLAVRHEESNSLLILFFVVFLFISIAIIIAIVSLGLKRFLVKTYPVEVEDSKGDSPSKKKSPTISQKSSD